MGVNKRQGQKHLHFWLQKLICIEIVMVVQRHSQPPCLSVYYLVYTVSQLYTHGSLQSNLVKWRPLKKPPNHFSNQFVEACRIYGQVLWRAQFHKIRLERTVSRYVSVTYYLQGVSDLNDVFSNNIFQWLFFNEVTFTTTKLMGQIHCSLVKYSLPAGWR